MAKESIWISGNLSDQAGPLHRFLPQVPEGVFAAWLKDNIPIGSLILDPFGSSPFPAIEAARAGYRVIVAANNPVARFLLDISANPPTDIELKAALAELSSAVKGNERLPQHISNLYQTECASCGANISAEAFLWERGANAPYARIYTCEKCGDSGEHPALESDATNAHAFQKQSLTWNRALERVAPLNDPDREHAEEALEAYLPRAVYTLMTLINAIDKLAPSPAASAERSAWIHRQRSLVALLLTACDRGNTLWSPGGARSRPRQLSRPARFVEYNLWKILEEAVKQRSTLNEERATIPVVIWPQLPPPGGGITIFEGRIRDLTDQLNTQPIQAMISTVPRPNQAYWSLSALWAGWLWGREASAPFKSVLRRRRYDWAWHTTALCSALQSIQISLKADTPFFTLVSEAEAGFITALFTAAQLSGLNLYSQALRSENNLFQAQWIIASQKQQTVPGEKAQDLPTNQLIQKIGLQACIDFLNARGEPSGILGIHISALNAIFDSLLLPPSEPNQAAEVYTAIQNGLQQAYLNRSELQRFGGSEGSLEGGKWWIVSSNKLTSKDPVVLPLSDRIEIAIVKAFQSHPSWEISELDRHLCNEFPGLNTPDMSLIRACIESYAIEKNPGKWVLRDGEKVLERRKDLGEIRQLLDQVMSRIGLTTRAPLVELPESQYSLVYEKNDGTPVYQFQVIVSAVFGPLMDISITAKRKAYILCPGSRAILIDYKTRNNPLMGIQIQHSWKYIKFRLLRRVYESMPGDYESLEKQLDLDPLMNRDPQIQLL